jgi:hypothetical protein
MPDRSYEILRRHALDRRRELADTLSRLDRRISGSVVAAAGSPEVSDGIGAAVGWVKARPRLALLVAGAVGWWFSRLRRPKHAVLILPDGEQRRVELDSSPIADALKTLAPLLETALMQAMAPQEEPPRTNGAAPMAAVERERAS